MVTSHKRRKVVARGSEDGDDAAEPSEEQRRAALLREVGKDLGGSAKDVLTMLAVLSLDFVTPQHVQAFLEKLKCHDGALCARATHIRSKSDYSHNALRARNKVPQGL